MFNPHKEERRAQLGKGKLTWWRKYHHHVQSDFVESGRFKIEPQQNYYFNKFINPSFTNHGNAMIAMQESFKKWESLGKKDKWYIIYRENMAESFDIIGFQESDIDLTERDLGICRHFLKLSQEAADAVDDGQRVAYKHYTFSILYDMKADWIRKTVQIIEAELEKE